MSFYIKSTRRPLLIVLHEKLLLLKGLPFICHCSLSTACPPPSQKRKGSNRTATSSNLFCHLLPFKFC